MRTIAALLLISVAGCSVPSYSLRSSSTTPLVASGEPRPIVLVPSVRRGHSTMWKTGAIITFCSMGVTLAGAWMTIASLGNKFDTSQSGFDNAGLFLAGVISSAIGDGGMLIGGPITWISGIGRAPE
jgi:hypothetical protein